MLEKQQYSFQRLLFAWVIKLTFIFPGADKRSYFFMPHTFPYVFDLRLSLLNPHKIFTLTPVLNNLYLFTHVEFTPLRPQSSEHSQPVASYHFDNSKKNPGVLQSSCFSNVAE